MSPHDLPVSVEEIWTAVRWHGYVCVTDPGLVAPGVTTWGWGPSTYKAMVSACGTSLADRLCQAIDNGGRLTEWSNIDLPDVPLLSCDLVNDEGQILCRFYK